METILVVDDNAFVLNSISAALVHAGFDVLTSRSPHEALRIAIQHSDPIHLILADVILPDMSGPQLASELLSLHPESRSLFMTGLHDSPLVAEQVLGRGLECLRKPFLPNVMVKKVREVLAAPARPATSRTMGAQG